MNPAPEVEYRPNSAVQTSTLVVVNIIWWMVMIAAIGLGAMHLGHCPLQPKIPIYLIVLGASSLLSLSLTYTRNTCEDVFCSVLIQVCMTVLHLFSFGWFIAGTIWVYPIYPPNYTPGAAPFCHKTTYQFSFVVTTLVWVTLTLMFACGCCFALLICCRTVIAGRRLLPSRVSFYGATSLFQEPAAAAAAGDV